MRSVSSSPSVSAKTVVFFIFVLAATLAAVPSAQAQSEIHRAEIARPDWIELAWSPLADLYAGRSFDADVSLADSGVTSAPAPGAIQPPARPRGAVNPRKALMLSLLLPGAGELYSGHKGRATGFFLAEGAIWANFVAWQISGRLRRDNYIEQAQLNAGLQTDSESDDFWRLVGTYTRSSGSGTDSYEDALRRDARNEFPSDPAAQDAWVAERLPVGNRAWTWSSAEARDRYLDTRHNSTRAFSRAKFSFALAILNRIASAIDTQRLHRADSKSEQSAIDGSELRILTDVTADGGGRLLVRRTF